MESFACIKAGSEVYIFPVNQVRTKHVTDPGLHVTGKIQTEFTLHYIACTVHEFTLHVYASWVHVYGSVGCMYAVVGCKVCGYVWVHA